MQQVYSGALSPPECHAGGRNQQREKRHGTEYYNPGSWGGSQQGSPQSHHPNSNIQALCSNIKGYNVPGAVLWLFCSPGLRARHNLTQLDVYVAKILCSMQDVGWGRVNCTPSPPSFDHWVVLLHGTRPTNRALCVWDVRPSPSLSWQLRSWVKPSAQACRVTLQVMPTVLVPRGSIRRPSL